MAKDDSIVIEKRKDIGDDGEQKKQGVPAGYDADNFEPMGKKGDKSTKSGEMFKNTSKSSTPVLESDMGKKGSGGYSSKLPENTLITDDGFKGMGKSGTGSV